jgi:arylsulfatase A-like enzyme
MTRLALWIVILLALGRGTLSVAAEPKARPNVLLIVTDDQRPDTIAALGNPVIRTPTLDRLVREGTTFTRAVCAYPICVVSRAELLTGCTAFRAQRPYSTGPLNDSLPRWPEVMKAAGYRTWYVGKWHTTGRPTNRGYEATRGLFASGGKSPEQQLDRRGQSVTGYSGWVFQDDSGQKFPERGIGLTPNISEAFADAAIELIERQDERPFFLHVNFTSPHDPRFFPKGYERAYEPARMPLPKNFAAEHPFDHGNLRGRDEVLLPRPLREDDVREELACYYALITHLDAQIGRMLAALDRTGQRNNTIVIFTSDHGLAVGSHGLTGKQNMYEHTIGVPLLMSGPGLRGRAKINAPCYLRDLFPTVCELCDLDAPKEIDGRSLKTVLEGGTGPHEFVVGYFQDVQRMIRTDRWKLIRYPKIDREQLFDLQSDPDELHDLIDQSEHQAVAVKLRRTLLQWLTDHGDPLLSKSDR